MALVDPRQVLDELSGSNRFVIESSRISIPSAGESEARALLFVEQIDEDLHFRVAPARDDDVFSVVPTREEVGPQYEVLDDRGMPIAQLEKDFGRSTLRDFWYVRDARTRELFRAREASLRTAVLRRALDVLPLGPARTPFTFVLDRRGEQVGTLRRGLLELADGFGVDRRVVLAWAVAARGSS